MRCKLHDLACGADGLCVVCRREGRVSKRPKTAPVIRPSGVWVALGVLAAAMATGVFYRVRTPPAAPLVVAPDTSSRVINAAPAAPRDPPRGLDDAPPTNTRNAAPSARPPPTPFAQRLAMFEASARAAASAAPSSSAPSSSASAPSPVTRAAGPPAM